MSQFAHGISAFDVATPGALDAPVYLLGRKFHSANDADAYQAAFDAILWWTYRRDFTKMEPYDYTSDAGWGCMLRSAQMLLSQALQRHLLGREWTKPRLATLPSPYIDLLTWFVDSPQRECLFSIHNMVKLGLQYDKLPGEWYGPTTAALVLRDLVNLYSRDRGCGNLAMYVPQEGVVYSDDVHKLVVSHLDDSEDEGPTTTAPPSGVAFFDPLLHPPTNDAAKEWTRSLLILIPLRLGLDSLNESYVPALDKTFAFPQSVGIIGGKKGHSVYFVGAQADRLHLLDPHDVQPTTEIDTSFPTASHLRTVHAPHPLVMNMQSIDPSLALGFLCESRADYADFCRRVRDMQQEFGSMCPFSVADRRPDYAASEMEMMMADCMLTSPGDSLHEDQLNGGISPHEDDEEEYVLI